MNIDIVNTHVASKLNAKVEDVKLVNKFYWDSINNHLYSFNPAPINIDGICVLYAHPFLLKKAILKYIHMIRKTRRSTKFKPDSILRKAYIEKQLKMLIGFLKIRKHNKFTN